MKWWKDETDSGTGSFWDFPCTSFFFSLCSEIFLSVSCVCLGASRRSDAPAQPSFSHVISFNAPAALLVAFLRRDLFLLYLLPAVISHPLQPNPKKRHDMQCKGLISYCRAVDGGEQLWTCLLLPLSLWYWSQTWLNTSDGSYQIIHTHKHKGYFTNGQRGVHSFQWSCSLEPRGVSFYFVYFRHLFHFCHVLFSFWGRMGFLTAVPQMATTLNRCAPPPIVEVWNPLLAIHPPGKLEQESQIKQRHFSLARLATRLSSWV